MTHPDTRRIELWTKLLCAGLCGLMGLSGKALANPELELQVDQHGDFILFGNTLAQECSDLGRPPEIPAPLVGSIGECPEVSPSAPDVYYRSDDPEPGSARADANIEPSQARTTAVLSLPDGARITHARLYWGAYASDQTPDSRVRIERPSAGLDRSLSAQRVWSVQETPSDSGRYWYHAAVDVTDILGSSGAGAYRVGDVSSVPLSDLQGDYYGYVAWYIVVFYEKESEPQRNLALFEGLDLVGPDAPASVTLQGFLVPPSEVGFDAKLGVVAFEGDAVFPGDALIFDGTELSDDQNPIDNFFNSTRSRFGEAISVPGDLPQLTGTPRSMSGLDMDVLDVTSLVQPKQTEATLQATSTEDTYLLASFITSIATFKPDFQGSEKSIRDLNGGEVVVGDELEYTIALRNRGSDASVHTIVRDVIPDGVSYVPGSIVIADGPGAGAKTDASGDDDAEYDSVMRTVVVRVGTGAGSADGGSLAIGETVRVRFRVEVVAATAGVIRNQGLVIAAGEKGAASEVTRTDGDITQAGSQSTDVAVEGCTRSNDCSDPKPLCDTSRNPAVCVECVTSLDCNDRDKPDCSTETRRCGCVNGPGGCQRDRDGDGVSDEGEKAIGTDPDDADSDDDGLIDGAELSPELDSDGDGLTNAHDADSDNDALFDGTERGQGCDNPDTDRELRRCRRDADDGDSQTNPLSADSDRAGVSDGSEDFNLNGKLEAGESDPSAGHDRDDQAHDRDRDGLSDELEDFLHSDPSDADTDDDGVPDAAEPNPSEDTDLDRRVNVIDVDSDDDALFDGTELGRDCSGEGTSSMSRHCRADADSAQTTTCALLRDTDGGGARDGAEDVDANGRVDRGERDPNVGHAADDADSIDRDGDGLSDGLEAHAGSAPNDSDSDDDGLLDGEESNPLDDQDGDGAINLLDPDSDADHVFDGTERGKGCDAPATDASRSSCTPDADGGRTTSGALSPDSDYGSVSDGIEDGDHNGRIDPAELDPNDPRDDIIGKACSVDADCGPIDSGRVCSRMTCTFGCRGRGGNRCPSPLYCSSFSEEPGTCGTTAPEPVTEPDAGATEPDAGDTETSTNPATDRPDAGWGSADKLQGGGCDCHAVTPISRSAGRSLRAQLLWLALGLGLLGWRRTRR